MAAAGHIEKCDFSTYSKNVIYMVPMLLEILQVGPHQEFWPFHFTLKSNMATNVNFHIFRKLCRLNVHTLRQY